MVNLNPQGVAFISSPSINDVTVCPGGCSLLCVKAVVVRDEITWLFVYEIESS
jgi:hypothetical protein